MSRERLVKGGSCLGKWTPHYQRQLPGCVPWSRATFREVIPKGLMILTCRSDVGCQSIQYCTFNLLSCTCPVSELIPLTFDHRAKWRRFSDTPQFAIGDRPKAGKIIRTDATVLSLAPPRGLVGDRRPLYLRKSSMGKLLSITLSFGSR
jgi:hypothetical protein